MIGKIATVHPSKRLGASYLGLAVYEWGGAGGVGLSNESISMLENVVSKCPGG